MPVADAQLNPPPTAHVHPLRQATVVLLDGIALLGFLALVFLYGVFPLKDTDFWWHLRTGDLIRQTGQIPHHDIYTFTVPPEHPWIDLHWGFEVLLSLGYQAGGVVGLNLGKCVITTLAVLLLVTSRRRGWPLWVMLLAWLPALYVLSGRMYVRPETLSLLYLSIVLAVVFRWERFPKLAFLLPVVQVLWVNTQGLFVFGPIIVGMALVDAALRPGAFQAERRGWWRTVLIASVLTGLACLVNPYFLSGALFPLELARTMRNPIFSKFIAELRPVGKFLEETGLRNFQVQMHLITMIVGALSFLLYLGGRALARKKASEDSARSKPDASARKDKRNRKAAAKKAEAADASQPERAGHLSALRVLLFLAFSVLSFQATRNSHQFAAVVGTVTAWNLGEWAGALRARRPGPSRRLPRLLAIAVIGANLGLLASGALYEHAAEGRTIGLGEEPLWFPHEAVKFCGTPNMPERFLGFHIGHNSLYEYDYGPNRKVYADARLEVIGPELFQQYMGLERAIEADQPTWSAELDRLGRPVVLVDLIEGSTSTAAASLLAHPRWRCVWLDPIAAVFVHESYGEVVRKHTIDFGARHFRAEAPAGVPDVPALLSEAKGIRSVVRALNGKQRFDLIRPLAAVGLDRARAAKKADPARAEGWRYTGELELFREPLPDASVPRFRMPLDPVFDLASLRITYNLSEALKRDSSDFMTLFWLMQVCQWRGMDEEALRLLEQLATIEPINGYQILTQEQARQEIPRLRQKLGPPPGLAKPANRAEFDRQVAELLASGRATLAADWIEQNSPSKALPWADADRLAALRLHLGQPERARAVWQAAIDPPSDALRLARVALTYLIEDDFDMARVKYRDALEADPRLFEADYGLAVLEQDAGHAHAALAAARAAQEHASGDVAQAAARQIAAWVRPYASALNSR